MAISFSVRPLRLVTWMGGLACFFGFLGAALIIVLRVMNPDEFTGQAAGWASLMVSVLVVSGMQMLSLGLLGEYVGRTYANVSRKPQAIVAETVAAKAGDR